MPAALPKHFSMIREFHLADVLTLGNAACGLAGVLFSMLYMESRSHTHFFAATAMAPAALLFDWLDGRVARWRRQQRRKGCRRAPATQQRLNGTLRYCSGAARRRGYVRLKLQTMISTTANGTRRTSIQARAMSSRYRKQRNTAPRRATRASIISCSRATGCARA